MARFSYFFLMMTLLIGANPLLANTNGLVSLGDLCKDLGAYEKKTVRIVGIASIPSAKAIGEILQKQAWSLKSKEVRLNINGAKRPTLGKRYGVEATVDQGAVLAKKVIPLLSGSTNDRLLKMGKALEKRNPHYGTKLSELLEGKNALSHWDLVDEWGRRARLFFLPEMEEAQKGYLFELTSAGPDGEFGTLDDLVWHPKAINPRPNRWGPPCEEELE